VSEKPPLSLQKARNYAFYLLKFRSRSEKEIFQRLKRKKFDPALIEQTVAFLKEKGFVNDADFARSWIDSRIKKPLGLRKLKEELRLKGIDNEIINNQLERIKKDYSEEAVVRQVAQERFAKSKAIEPQKAKRRIFAYLLRHGFSPEVVIDALNNL
jgi:regulatory protein